MMREFIMDERPKENIQAECRRLEAAGYKVMYYVQPTYSTEQRFRPLSQYDLGYYDFTVPGIRAFR
jgi:hypothetical protein